MAKIGTAHVEIKPVLNEEALDAIVECIEAAVEAGMTRALDKANRHVGKDINAAAARATRKPAEPLSRDEFDAIRRNH